MIKQVEGLCAELDPGQLTRYGVAVNDIVNAINNNTAIAGGLCSGASGEIASNRSNVGSSTRTA